MRWQAIDTRQWHRVFAWWPVRIGSRWIWLEHYERKLDRVGVWGDGYYSVRVIDRGPL